MKRLFVAALLACIAIPVAASEEKGTKYGAGVTQQTPWRWRTCLPRQITTWAT